MAGPFVLTIVRFKATMSSLSEVRGRGAATTCSPSLLRRRMTSFQLDPSAQAPWATTTVLFSGNGMSRFGDSELISYFRVHRFLIFGLPVLSTCDLENNLQLDRRAEWKA